MKYRSGEIFSAGSLDDKRSHWHRGGDDAAPAKSRSSKPHGENPVRIVYLIVKFLLEGEIKSNVSLVPLLDFD